MGFVRPLTPAWAMSALRIITLKARFGPRIEIGFDSYVGPRCRIHVARGSVLRLQSVKATWDVVLDVSAHAVIEAGPMVWLGPGTTIAAQQRVALGAGCMLAEYVTIRDHDHLHDAHQLLMSDPRYTVAPVTIGDNVWLGSKATVISGVTVGDHALVAANAVVTRDVKPGERVGGVPARPLSKHAPRGTEVVS